MGMRLVESGLGMRPVEIGLGMRLVGTRSGNEASGTSSENEARLVGSLATHQCNDIKGHEVDSSQPISSNLFKCRSKSFLQEKIQSTGVDIADLETNHSMDHFSVMCYTASAGCMRLL